MFTRRRHRETHRIGRLGWLRAAVLGANDGIVSTASLIVGMAAANASPQVVIVAGCAGLVAGALSMAAGEYVSVHSQADGEAADLVRERVELEQDPEAERRELTAIYVDRGLDPALAREVARQLMSRDALGAHARDELGVSPATAPRPVQAAAASAASFAVGAALPLAVVLVVGTGHTVAWVAATSVVFLGVLGATAARAGGARVLAGATRVMLWGAFAMLATAVVGAAFGVG